MPRARRPILALRRTRAACRETSRHEIRVANRDLEAVREYARRAWRRPVRLHTINDRSEAIELAA